MECQEAERLVMPYIQDELPTPVLEEFLEHIQVCPQCQEELEIYFTVAEGLRHLEEETGSYNIAGRWSGSWKLPASGCSLPAW